MKIRLLLCASLLLAPHLRAQAPAAKPSPEQLKTWVALRQERVGVLRAEIQKLDTSIESRLDLLIETLRTIGDSKDSRTKVARMKEETGKRLMKTVEEYDRKRAALKEELRNPRLHLTAAEKQQAIGAFDARIEKRTQQILALNKSMPTHQDYERYTATGGGLWGTQYERNRDYEQNRRMTSHSNTQRDAIVKQLDASIARLDRQLRTLKAQPPQAGQQTQEISRTEALIAERRRQRAELFSGSDVARREIPLKEASDLDKGIQKEVEGLRRDMTTLFQCYHSLLSELSYQHATEAALAGAQAH